MTIEEACQLVIQAGAIGRPGEALVLDMGEPVRIVDVAHQLIQQSAARPVEIEFTGLREGEKLHEELFGDGEPQRHPTRAPPGVARAGAARRRLRGRQPPDIGEHARGSGPQGHGRPLPQ